ncbi:MAG: repair protein SbcD/Mre11 [Clostridiales bacterium]|nr:repair protein SbcD/Mre11 [Clostridiales bacterium]MDN5283174.1 repair protein SbcD/Mre11 [Candidatus Ozemobacter sp.]
MRFIHTSDWHLGQHLMTRSRQPEHEKFLNWLLQQISNREIDTLLVGGDIFDTGTPPGYAQKMYYDFLCRLASAGCRRAFVIGGNHDSPAFLEASRQILEHLNISVIPRATEDPEDLISLCSDANGLPEAIVAAVPFLRDRDVRKSQAGESYDEKALAVNKGIAGFYEQISDMVAKIKADKKLNVPVIATGHLYVAGCSTSESVRELNIGNLGAIRLADLENRFDYLALGHLHKAQLVGGNELVRYCGSPVPMNFEESLQPCRIIVGDTSNGMKVEEVEVPQFQKMVLLKGSYEEILNGLGELDDNPCWIEVQCTDEKEIPQLGQTLRDKVEGSNHEILAVKQLRKFFPGLSADEFNSNNLNELKPEEVFAKRLESETDMSEDEQADLKAAFNELLQMVYAGEKP